MLNEIYKSLFELNSDASYALSLTGRFIYVNKSCTAITGYQEEELLRMSYEQLFNEHERGRMLRIFERVKNGETAQFETKITSKSGTTMDVSVTAIPILTNGSVQGIMAIGKDLSEKKKIQQELIFSQNQLKNIMESINICLWSWDMLKDGFLFVTPACHKIYGYTEEQFYRDPYLWKKVIHPEEVQDVETRRKSLYNKVSLKLEYRIIDANGTVKWVRDYTVPVFNDCGKMIRLDGVISDISQEKRIEAQLHFQANHDSLTKLPNRRYFIKYLIKAIHKAKNENTKVAIIYLDLDEFKSLNDSLGHEEGDRLLVTMAGRLKSCLGKGEVIARLGGDEFAILLEGAGNDDINQLAGRLLEAIAQPYLVKNFEFLMTGSAGISIFPEHGKIANTLIKHADQAMYRAKEEGKGQYRVYQYEMSRELSRKVFLVQSLYRALELNELEVFYQPIMNTVEERLEGLEALVRWNHSSQGIIPPSDFIPLAEESGRIIAIGEWVLKQACIHNKLLQEKGFPPIYIAVNVSARQLQHCGFTEMVIRVLEDTGLEPKWLKLEITESAAMTNVKEMLKVLGRLGRLGVKIAIDDFGTGYSSLSYLKKFPISTLKIDKSFISDINNDANQEAIIRAIVAMANSLKMQVVAEGVETEKQMEFLREIGCHLIQGYYFHQPTPFEMVEKLFQLMPSIE